MNNIITILISTFAVGTSILFAPKANAVQIDMSLLTETAGSCQKDVNSFEYYNSKLGLSINESEIKAKGDRYYRNKCIQSRYFYSQILSQFPWLASAEEMLPGYPGSVAVSELAANKDFKGYSPHIMARSVANDYTHPSTFIDCLSTLDTYSEECRKRDALGTLYYARSSNLDASIKSNHSSSYKGWGLSLLLCCLQ